MTGLTIWLLVGEVLIALSLTTYFYFQLRSLRQENQKLNQQTPDREQKFYRTIVESQRQFILCWSLTDFCITYANPAYCEYLRSDLQELIGRNIETLVHPDDWEWVQKKLTLVNAKYPRVSIKYRVLLASQEIRWQTWDHQIIYHESEHFEMQAEGRDITQNHLIEEVLERLENSNRVLLESIPDSIFLVNRQGKFLDFHSRLPFNNSSPLYPRLQDFLAPISDRVLRLIEIVLSSQELQTFEYDRQEDEETYYYEARIMPSGEQEVLLVIRDVTDRKRVEETTLALIREQEINEVQQHFFAMISHEFRTPLNVMAMSIGILETTNPEQQTEKTIRNLHRIKLASQRILTTLDNMMTIYQIKTDFFIPTWEPLNIVTLCQSIINEIRGDEDFVITLHSKEPNRIFYSDSRLLHAILENLLTNAIKYSQQPIHIEVDYQTTTVEIKITDRGIGIPSAEVSHIFEPFFRGSNVDGILGSGLGLSVVQKCVEVCQGTIGVSSNNSGTTFNIYLPIDPRELSNH